MTSGDGQSRSEPGSTSRSKPPSIYDVAAAAGVSVSTVSRALAKPDRVSFRTAEHVRRVATDLGYRTQATERVIARALTGRLAMIVADITNPVFYGLIRGAERAAAEAGYTLLLVETQESEQSERAVFDNVWSAVDGVILTSSRMSDTAIRSTAKVSPLVVLNRLVDQVPSVAGDNIRGIKRAVEHLAEHGHRSITYLSGPEASWANGMRWRGVLEAGHELGLKTRRSGPFPPTMKGGLQAVRTWRAARSTAVIAYNDLLAIGFVRALVAEGLGVPTDVSVVGFDDIRDARLIDPPLTTVAVPLAQLGSAAVTHLLRTKASKDSAAKSVVLPAKLVVRGSTGPAPAS